MSTHPDLKFNTPTWQVERDPKYNLLVTPSRSYRGSPWSVTADYARVADRSRVDPDSRATFIGFRLVRDSMAPEVAK
jgi:formylglycine-generating enzyme required for sulfatase activity